MKKRNLGYAIVVVQSFALFVALSIFLGRVYFITYYDMLGIPTSEIRLNPIDYTIISPDVTILGIGMTILIVGLFWLGRSYSVGAWDFNRILVGSIMLTIGFAIAFIPFEQQLQFSRPGLLGLRELVQAAFIITGAYLVSSSIPLKEGSTNIAGHSSKTSTILLPLFLFMTIVAAFLVVYLITTSSSKVARIDATRILEDTTQVYIEFNKEVHASIIDDELVECMVDINVCTFQLILVGDRFVYVRSQDYSRAASQTSIYAFPIDNIVQIGYVFRSAVN